MYLEQGKYSLIVPKKYLCFMKETYKEQAVFLILKSSVRKKVPITNKGPQTICNFFGLG